MEAYFMHCILRLSSFLLEDHIRLGVSLSKAVSTLCFLSQFVNDSFIEKVCIPTIYTVLVQRQVAETIPGMLFLLNLLSAPSDNVYYYPLLCLVEMLLDQASLDLFRDSFFQRMREFPPAPAARLDQLERRPSMSAKEQGTFRPQSAVGPAPGPVGKSSQGPDASVLVQVLKVTIGSSDGLIINARYRFPPWLCARYIQYFVATIARFSRGDPVIRAVVTYLFTGLKRNMVYFILERESPALQTSLLGSIDLVLRLIPSLSQPLLQKVTECAPGIVGSFLGMNAKHFGKILMEPDFFARMTFDNLCDFVSVLSSLDISDSFWSCAISSAGPSDVDAEVAEFPISTLAEKLTSQHHTLSVSALTEGLQVEPSVHEVSANAPEDVPEDVPEGLFRITDTCLTIVQRIAFTLSFFLPRGMVWATPAYPISVISRILVSLASRLPKAALPEFVTYLNNNVTCKFYESLRYYILLLLLDVSQDFRENADPEWFGRTGTSPIYQDYFFSGDAMPDSQARREPLAPFACPPRFRDFIDTRQLAMRQMILNLVCETLYDRGLLEGINFGSFVAGRENFDLYWIQDNVELEAKSPRTQFTVALLEADLSSSGAAALASAIISARTRLCSAVCAVLDKIYLPIKANSGLCASSRLLDCLGTPASETPRSALAVPPGAALSAQRALRETSFPRPAAQESPDEGSGQKSGVPTADSSMVSTSPSGILDGEGGSKPSKQAKLKTKTSRFMNLIRNRRNSSISSQAGGLSSRKLASLTARGITREPHPGQRLSRGGMTPLFAGLRDRAVVVFDPVALGDVRAVFGVPTTSLYAPPPIPPRDLDLARLECPRDELISLDALKPLRRAILENSQLKSDAPSQKGITGIGPGDLLSVLWGVSSSFSADAGVTPWRLVAPNLTGEFLGLALSQALENLVTVAPGSTLDVAWDSRGDASAVAPLVEKYLRNFSRASGMNVSALLRSLPCFSEILARAYNNLSPPEAGLRTAASASSTSPAPSTSRVLPLTLVYPNINALCDSSVLARLSATLAALSAYNAISEQAVGDILLGSATLSGAQSSNVIYNCVSNAKLASSRAMLRRSVFFQTTRSSVVLDDGSAGSQQAAKGSGVPVRRALSLAASLTVPLSRKADGSAAELIAIAFDRHSNLLAVADSEGFVTIFANPLGDTTSYVCRKLLDVASVATEVVYSSSVNFALSEAFRANLEPRDSFFGPLLPRSLRVREVRGSAAPPPQAQALSAIDVVPGVSSSVISITANELAALIAAGPLSRPMARFRAPEHVSKLYFDSGCLTLVGPSGIVLLEVDERSLSLRFMLALLDEVRYGKVRAPDDCLLLGLGKSYLRICNRTPLSGAYASASTNISGLGPSSWAQLPLLSDLAAQMRREAGSGKPRVLSVPANTVDPVASLRTNLCLLSRLTELYDSRCRFSEPAMAFEGGSVIRDSLQVYSRPRDSLHVVVTPDTVSLMELKTGRVVLTLPFTPLCIYGGPETSLPALESHRPRIVGDAKAYLEVKTGRVAPAGVPEMLETHLPALPSIILSEGAGRITYASRQEEGETQVAFCTNRNLVLVFDLEKFCFVDFYQFDQPTLEAFSIRAEAFMTAVKRRRAQEVAGSLKAREASLHDDFSLGEGRVSASANGDQSGPNMALSSRVIVIRLPRSCVLISAMLPVLGPLLTIAPVQPELALVHVSPWQGTILTGWSDGSLLMTTLGEHPRTVGLPTIPAAWSSLSVQGSEAHIFSQHGSRLNRMDRLSAERKGDVISVGWLASDISSEASGRIMESGLTLSDELVASRKEEHQDLVAATCAGGDVLFSADRRGRVLAWKWA